MRFAALATALLCTGCYQSFERPSGATPGRSDGGPTIRTDAGPPARTDGGGPTPDAGPTADAGPSVSRAADILLVVDNSSSMREEQTSLAVEMPGLLRILSTGDFDLDGRLDGPDDFLPIDVQLGVVTTDMGVGGFAVPTCGNADFGDDGVLRGTPPDSRCDGPGPAFLAFGGGASAAQVETAQCRVAQGVEGCGFEQPLEAALKALSPAVADTRLAPDYRPPLFYRNTSGHGTDTNRGFLRNGSVLVVAPVTDEDDCSTEDVSLFDLSPSSRFAMTGPNVRCFVHEDAALHPTSRFARGLIQLRRSPARVVFAPILGVPVDLAGLGPIDWDQLISDDLTLRDERMIRRVDSTGDAMIPSCNVPGRGFATPPIRLLQTAREIEQLGGRVNITSICQESFRAMIEQIVRALKG